ncbi:MAG: DUF2335 domain-containing protein [Magnetococcales bacterium]|nr:DUF2335 domain-containing protein [Magnetococcales bacterium]
MSDPLADITPAIPQQEESESSRLLIQRAQYIGPIPPPQMLAEYGKIVPDFPERIVSRFEEEGHHRAAMEREAMSLQSRGQWMAMLMGLTAIIGSVILTLNGHDWVGGVMGGGTVVGLVTVFISGRATRSEL